MIDILDEQQLYLTKIVTKEQEREKEMQLKLKAGLGKDYWSKNLTIDRYETFSF